MCKIFWGFNLGQYKMEQLSPIPPKAMMKARRSKKRAILASLKWGEGWSRCSIYFVQDLGQYKMEQLSPIPPPQSNDEGAKEQETRHFDIIEMGGGVVQMFHLFCPRLLLA